MTKPRTLTSNEEMAYHLEATARGCLDGNAYALGEARRMLASKVLLAALEVVEATIEGPNTSVAERLAVRSVVQHAIAEATGDKP